MEGLNGMAQIAEVVAPAAAVGAESTAVAAILPTAEVSAMTVGMPNLEAAMPDIDMSPTSIANREIPITEPTLDSNIETEISNIVAQAGEKPLADIEAEAGLKALANMPVSSEAASTPLSVENVVKMPDQTDNIPPQVDALEVDDTTGEHPGGSLKETDGIQLANDAAKKLETNDNTDSTNTESAAQEPQTAENANDKTNEKQDPQARKDVLRQKAKDGKLTDNEASELNQINSNEKDGSKLDDLNNRLANGDSLTPEEEQNRNKLQEKFNEAENTAEISTDPIDQPSNERQLTRAQKEADIKAHNDRDARVGKIDQEEADRRTNEAMAKWDKENPKAETSENGETTEETKARLDVDIEEAQKELSEGKITPAQYSKRIEQNHSERRTMVEQLVAKLNEEDGELNAFEKEVAETANKMEILFYEIMMAPETLDQMEIPLGKMKKQFNEAQQFKITEENANTKETRQNIRSRNILSKRIVAQATSMAKYANITEINVNEFLSINNKLDTMVGNRSGFRYLLVAIGTDVNSRIKDYKTTATAAQIAKSGKAPKA